MLSVQQLPDKTLGNPIEPCAICGSTTAPRIVDAGYTVCESQPMCWKRRYGTFDRGEPWEVRS